MPCSAFAAAGPRETPLHGANPVTLRLYAKGHRDNSVRAAINAASVSQVDIDSSRRWQRPQSRWRLATCFTICTTYLLRAS